MKYPLLTLSILLLSSCQEYRYDVSYEKCNWQTGSLSTRMVWEYKLDGANRQIYLVHDLWWREYIDINNVCDFSYTRTEIK
jgi:hypothetical protein